MRDVNHFQAADIEAATAILERYVHPDTLEPVLVHGTDRLIDECIEQHRKLGRNLRRVRAAKLVAERFISLRLDIDTRIESYSLDIDPEQPGRPVLYGHIEQPQICFVALPDGSHISEQYDAEAAAFFYQPDPAVTRRTERGIVRCSDFSHSGYLGFVRFFASEDEAYAAAAELKQAIQTLAAPLDEGDRPDPVRHTSGHFDRPEDIVPF